MKVSNYQDEEIASVDDLAVDLESGRIVQAILSTGGFLGMGDRLSAVPPGALRHDVAKKVLRLDVNKEKLKGAPEFRSAKWEEDSDYDHLSAVYTYYGQEPAFTFINRGDPTDGAAKAAPGRNTDGTSADDRWMIPPSRLGQIQKATKVIGLAVKNRQDESLGTVDNLLLDMQSGRIVAVVVSSGGFLGIGDALSAVPPTALSFNVGRDALQLDTTKDKLIAAPHFTSDQWPDFNQPEYADSVYRAYQVEPYFATTTTTDADNTARNVRDRDDRTLTPMDQGSSKADTEITAKVRQGILAVKDMSLDAKNVKIITINGRVTLRGPVGSQEEKRLIGELANRIARSGNVDNQLEVTLKPPTN